MLAKLRDVCRSFQRAKVYAELTVDHVELAETYLMLGLNLAWHNGTAAPILIQEVHVSLFHQGRNKEPIRFYPQGHFARVPGQRVINKIAGPKSFQLPVGAAHVECIRFFTRAVLDLPEKTYPVEIHVTAPEGTYVHEAEIPITNQLKYRTSDACLV